MKRFLIALVIHLALFHSAIAQTTPQSEGAKSGELQEASRLSTQVVELYNKDRYDEAMPLAKRALEIRERALGASDQLTGDALQNLASLYAAKKNYGEALSLYKRALAIFEKALGPENAKTANIIQNMGWLFYADGNTSKAEENFQRSLGIREKVLGPTHPDVAVSLDLLAQFYQQQLKYGKAVEYYKRAFDVKEKALGPDNKELVEFAKKCACAMLQNKQSKEAMEMGVRARMIEEGRTFNPGSFSGSFIQGKATFRKEPEYPLAAKRARITGAVVIEVTVNTDGKVLDAKMICGPNIFAAAAIEAARQWQFSPTQLNGRSVKVIGTITFNFNM